MWFRKLNAIKVMSKWSDDMKQRSVQHVSPNSPEAIPTEIGRIEGRKWWLWGFAIVVTLALTLGIISFTLPWFTREPDASYWLDLREWVRGLAALVLLFDIYAVYQHLQLHRTRRQLAERDQLFQLISENAADMIALVDSDGRRLYNSRAYQKVLGYSPEELKNTSSIEEIYPDDHARVSKAAEKVRVSGQGERVEYRIRHKDGSWRTLESIANAIRNAKGGDRQTGYRKPRHHRPEAGRRNAGPQCIARWAHQLAPIARCFWTGCNTR
jgi:PAS domain S-box-containing protein